MNRNSIMNSLIADYKAYAATHSAGSIEKAFKYAGSPFEVRERADIKAEAAMFRYVSGNTLGLIEDSKPLELDQSWEVLVFVEQGDSHSVKNARYERLLAICDQLIDWSVEASPASINNDLYTITLNSVSPIDERGGYLSSTLTFSSLIKIQD